MGLLDDLKKQSDDLKAKEQQEKERQQRLNQYYQDEIHPGMLNIYKYLSQMIEHLNYIKGDTTAMIPLLPNHEKTALKQKEYNLVIDSVEQTKNITLKFECHLPNKIKVELFGKDKSLNYNDRLNAYKIKFHRRDNKDANYELLGSRFDVEGPLHCAVTFAGDVDNSCVNLFLRNIEGPGVTRHILKAHHLNDEFMDKLGKYLLRENEDFLKLDMDDSTRAQIRQNLAEAQKQREQEMIEVEQRLKEELDTKRSGLDKLFDKLKPKK